MSNMKIRSNIRVKPSKDRRVEEMVADPAAYFSKVRREAQRETRVYISKRDSGDGATKTA